MSQTMRARRAPANDVAPPGRPEVLSVSEVPAAPSPAGLYGKIGKRTIDVIGGSAAIVVTAPLLGAVWLSLRLALGPGVILYQQRIGKDGKTFELYKFRTMRFDRRSGPQGSGRAYIGSDRRTEHKTVADPRHTPLGRIIRKFSLDELPQLVNVVLGDMSLVGPRPELTSRATQAFVAHRRHAVRPGLTGPFQVTDLRTAGDLEAGLELDGSYADKVTLRDDLRYLLRTVTVLARGTGN